MDYAERDRQRRSMEFSQAKAACFANPRQSVNGSGRQPAAPRPNRQAITGQVEESPRSESLEPDITFPSGILVPYPRPIGEPARIGIAGRFLRCVEQHTEADPSFLLLQFLAYAGNAFGREAYVYASGDRHYPNFYVCAVGPTSTGRKGSARAPVEAFFRGIEEEWLRNANSGLSSGEGLIWCVRDPIMKREKVSKRGEPARYEDLCSDEGVKDKRLVVRQSEFAAALKVMKRDGNTLSPTLRDAWDFGNLNTMVKNSPAKASNAHISIVANITREELLRCMETGEVDNGLANRFLWCCSIRSRLLPEGGRDFDELPEFIELRKDFNRIQYRVKGKVERDVEAAELWGLNETPDRGAYRMLTREKFGMYGGATARGPAQVLRLALVYALLDGRDAIARHHLEAALECWRYCDESARYIFGDKLGNPTADTILSALRENAGGLTRREINSDLFGRHRSSEEITTALLLLQQGSLARCEREETGGRPGERWFANGGVQQ